MIGKTDEMRAKSEKFFGFFTEFFDKVNTNMPKIEKPKKEKAGGASKSAPASKLKNAG
jgi:hypothetical protein